MKRSLILAMVAIVIAVSIIAGVAVWLLTPPGPMYTIRMREYSFKLEGGDFPLQIKAGETVRIKLINEGTVNELQIHAGT